jgi:hyperosmotically inducible periplasmic protein
MGTNRQGSLFLARAVLVSASIVGIPFTALAQDQAKPPDNSAQNKAHDQTADNQKENTSDRETTQKVRQAIVKDKSLSTYAHNVKIITQNQRVTLKGPVQDESERDKVAAVAGKVVGPENVDNQLSVKH